MEVSEYDTIWKLIKKYKFENYVSLMNEDLTCVICNGLMVDACRNMCGCHCCYPCVVGYISDEDKYCPGGKNNCQEVHLKLVNAIRNPILNKNVSKVKVSCPNGSCVSNIELTELCDHLRLCTRQPMECPFTAIGCNNENGNKDSIVTHLSNDTLTHTQMLMDSINTLKNEINGLRHNFEKSLLEIEKIKEESSDKENRIDALERDSMNKENRIETLERESTNKENRIEKLEGELIEIRNTMEIRVNKEKEEREIIAPSKKIENVIMILNDLRNNVTEMREERQKYDEDRDIRMNKWVLWNKLCPNIVADFVWRIGECSQKRNAHLYSDSFYANNYKLCLCVYIYSDDIIGLFCCIMRGYNDDNVQWPMQRTVNLNIINQCTQNTHKSVTFKYDTYDRDKTAFEKPMKERNDCGIGLWKLIVYSSVEEGSSIIVNDSIVVSCILSNT